MTVNFELRFPSSRCQTLPQGCQVSDITSRFLGVRHYLKVPRCQILPQGSQVSDITSRFPSVIQLPQGSQLSDITSRFPVVRFYRNISKPRSSMRRDGRTDRPNETNSRFPQFCERALRRTWGCFSYILYASQNKQRSLYYTALGCLYHCAVRTGPLNQITFRP